MRVSRRSGGGRRESFRDELGRAGRDVEAFGFGIWDLGYEV